MPSVPCGVSSSPFAVISKPSTPEGGTAFTSAATSKCEAASWAVDKMRTPARPAHSAASVCTGESETPSLFHRRPAISAYGVLLTVLAIEMEYPERMLKMALIRETHRLSDLYDGHAT